VAALASILFGLLMDGLYFRIIPYFSQDNPLDLSFGSVLFTIFIAWGVFFVIAFLMNSLTENLRRTGEKLRLAQKELEIKERLAAAGQVAANLAHEIRNPLAAIAGSVQFLKDDVVLNHEQMNLMNIVIKESERVSQSIEQFLDLASPGKQVFSSINLPAILKETLTALQASGELNSLFRLEGNFKTARAQYFGNANQFRQVFWNLTKNALKAMPKGGALNVDFLNDSKKELKIRFADTGKGMSRESRERIFEPFYSGFENGRGLGMAVVRRIVDDYNGKIQVSSEIDKGTVIIITLPIWNKNSRKLGENGNHPDH
jgi:two-component system sensor histidine kinase PilS (NtrC family)